MHIGEGEREAIRRAYYVERKSQRQIAREGGWSRKVKGENEPGGRRGTLVYEPYRRRVEEMLEEQERVPVKQRYTAARIYKVIREEGYGGCESRVRVEVGKWKRCARWPVPVYRW